MPAISSYSSRKSRFLDRMNVLVPWQDIADKLLHVYPSSRRGRRPFPPGAYAPYPLPATLV